MPVHDVAASLEAGKAPTDVLAAYPTLEMADLELCRIYAQAYPAARSASAGQCSGRGEGHHRSPRRPTERWLKRLIDECLSPDLVRLARDRGSGESSHIVWLKRAGWKDWSASPHQHPGYGSPAE